MLRAKLRRIDFRNLRARYSQRYEQMSDDNIWVKPLIWGGHNDDMIIGSNLLYNTSVNVYYDLCSTIQAIDGTHRAKILLSVRWRKPEEERKFFQIMEAARCEFELILVDHEEDKGKEDSPMSSDLSWKEFGNPNCDRSNEFFTNTFVQVSIVSKPLKDVTEDDMHIMS